MPNVTEQSRRKFCNSWRQVAVRVHGLGRRSAGGAGQAERIHHVAPLQTDKLIKSPKDALNVFDFERRARSTCRRRISATCLRIDDEVTLRANREGFQKFSCGRAAWSTSAKST